MQKLDEMVRIRLRMCEWKSWKKIKTRIKKLIEQGVNKHKAYEWGNSSLGYCRISHSPILCTTLDNKYWQAKGYIGFSNYYYWKTEHQKKLF